MLSSAKTCKDYDSKTYKDLGVRLQRPEELRKEKDVYRIEGKFPPQKKNMGTPVKTELEEPCSQLPLDQVAQNIFCI